MTFVTEHFSTFSTVREIFIFSTYYCGTYSHYKEMSVIYIYIYVCAYICLHTNAYKVMRKSDKNYFGPSILLLGNKEKV